MHKEREYRHWFQKLLSGGLLSSGVNHYLPMNTSNWVRAFVFGCGSESKATGETVLAFVMCLWRKKTLLWRVYMWEASNTMGYIYKVKAKWMSWTSMFWTFNSGLFVYLKWCHWVKGSQGCNEVPNASETKRGLYTIPCRTHVKEQVLCVHFNWVLHYACA